MKLYDYQLEAVKKLHSGSILCGRVGSGKSITALYYFITKVCEGMVWPYVAMRKPRDLYIITTAKKRDSLEWESDIAKIGLGAFPCKITVDSWNNIKKYTGVYGAMFLFDEQRVVGKGAWVKAFLKIARANHWLLLSATPGDTWSDYIPVFVANGFYKNRSEFQARHCVFSRYAKYPKIEKYVGEKRLLELRDSILVGMDDLRITERHEVFVDVGFDVGKYRQVVRDRWDIYENEPIVESGKLLYLMRKVVNSDVGRLERCMELTLERKKTIIFYNYDYELELLRKGLDTASVPFSEWNGHKHELPLDGGLWAYLVQFQAGSEGWNCTTCDTMIFYSQTYSYRTLEQAMGRIDRVNTPFRDLWYYHLVSHAPIDKAIRSKLRVKENFNERSFIRRSMRY